MTWYDMSPAAGAEGPVVIMKNRETGLTRRWTSTASIKPPKRTAPHLHRSHRCGWKACSHSGPTGWLRRVFWCERPALLTHQTERGPIDRWASGKVTVLRVHLRRGEKTAASTRVWSVCVTREERFIDQDLSSGPLICSAELLLLVDDHMKTWYLKWHLKGRFSHKPSFWHLLLSLMYLRPLWLLFLWNRDISEIFWEMLQWFLFIQYNENHECVCVWTRSFSSFLSIQTVCVCVLFLFRPEVTAINSVRIKHTFIWRPSLVSLTHPLIKHTHTNQYTLHYQPQSL